METIIEKFLEIAIILVAAKIGAELMRRINQPAVIGELVAGIIIGYYGLGLLPHFEKEKRQQIYREEICILRFWSLRRPRELGQLPR